MTAQELAQKVSEFIKHNNIDTKLYTMDEIVKAYFEAQIQAINKAGELIKSRS